VLPQQLWQLRKVGRNPSRLGMIRWKRKKATSAGGLSFAEDKTIQQENPQTRH